VNAATLQNVASKNRLDWLLTAVVIAAAAWFVFSYGYLEDDAFIHLEYARSVASQGEFAFNGHVSHGDTAPLWVLILVGIHSLGVSWITTAKVACVLGLLSTVLSVLRVGQELARDASGLRYFPIVAVLVTLLNPYFAHWVFSGMESVTAVGLTFWIVLTGLLLPATPRYCLISALLLGIGPLLRPELLLLIGIVGPLLLWRFWSAPAGRSGINRVAWLLMMTLLMAAPLAIWSAYALHAFGAIIPNTNLAKKGGSLAEVGPRLFWVYALGFPVTLLLLPLVAVARQLRSNTPLPVIVLLVWPVVCMAFYLADHTNVQTRYALLSMPSLSIAILWLIGRGGWTRVFAMSAAAMALVGLGLIVQIVIPHITNKEQQVATFARLSAYIREHIPQTEPVAVYGIGEIAFLSRHPLVDTGGITDPSVVPYINNPSLTVIWAKSRGARYYITATPPEPAAVAVFTAPGAFTGWTLQRAKYAGSELVALYRLP
jgi:hypothetical protein